MKQLLIPVIALLSCSSIIHAQTIVSAVETTSAPTINGQIGVNEWNNATVFDFQGSNGVEVLGDSANTGDNDFSGSFRVMWDSTNVYLLLEISDDNNSWDDGGDWNQTYKDDSLEVYLDLSNTGSGDLDRGDGIFQYRFGLDGIAVGGIYGDTIHAYPDDNSGSGSGYPNITGIDYDYTLTGTNSNFIMEVIIPWATPNSDADNDFTPSIGESLGFTLAYNDDDDGNNRDAQHWWVATNGDAWNNASQWGTLELAAVPEPSTYALFFGFISLGFIVYKKRKNESN